MNETQVDTLQGTSGDAVGQFDVTGDTDFSSWSPGLLTATSVDNVNSAFNFLYEGDGTFSFTLNSSFSTSATFTGIDGYFQGNTPSGAMFAEVEYNYTAAEVVPEPGTAAMIAGLFAFVWVALRRRA